MFTTVLNDGNDGKGVGSKEVSIYCSLTPYYCLTTYYCLVYYCLDYCYIFWGYYS
jgi:hypothetical protein